MPIFIYFAVMAPVLLILICGSGIMLGPPKGLDLATAWHGLPSPSRRPIEDLSHRNDDYRPIPLPPDAAAAFAKANEPFAAPTSSAKKAQAEVKSPERKSRRRVARSYDERREFFRRGYDDFGPSGYYEQRRREHYRTWW